MDLSHFISCSCILIVIHIAATDPPTVVLGGQSQLEVVADEEIAQDDVERRVTEAYPVQEDNRASGTSHP